MFLDQLIDGAPADIAVRDLAYDSRRVSTGTVFFCVPGLRVDGHAFAKDAVERGAAALVVERPLGRVVPEVVVPSTRAAMALAAARFFGHPSSELAVVGVTGTNGKTTTCFLIRQLLEAAGVRCGLLGSVKAIIGGREHAVTRTTPEAIDLQRYLGTMVKKGDRVCAMEVSSHGLALGRADAVEFGAAVFTNLTQDHLDFHRTMDRYFKSKRKLFVPDPGVAIINVDDRFGRALARERPDAVTFAIDRPADYRASDLMTSIAGSRFAVEMIDRRLEIESTLPGRFNVYNALGAIAAAKSLGVSDEVIVEGMRRAVRPEGRFERVCEEAPFSVVVDYAHTPDALENLLDTAREIASGDVICVFGCGGDRDRSIRSAMGEIAARLADQVIVTTDDPHSEQPEKIQAEVLAGTDGRAEPILDRRSAITRCVELAQPGDIVLIAGRGHEQTQTFPDGSVIDFDDVKEARAAVRRVLATCPGNSRA